RWPVRPYAGMGAGFDVMRIRYRRSAADDYVAVGLRIGFELHGGSDIRISTYFGLLGEVRQLWSARIKTGSALPDVGATGFTVISGLKFGIPVGGGASATAREEQARKRKVRVVRKQQPVPPVVVPVPVPVPAPAVAPAPEAAPAVAPAPAPAPVPAPEAAPPEPAEAPVTVTDEAPASPADADE